MTRNDIRRATLGVATLALAASVQSALAAGPTCPSAGNPPPGSSVRGGFAVSGFCDLDGVKVNGGGINVNGGGHLELQNSTVRGGGILVDPNGELDINALPLGSGLPTHTTSTINGGITIDHPWDVDIQTAKIDGGIVQDGSGGPSFVTTICGNEVNGTSAFSNVQIQIGGGPSVINAALLCGDNTFNGSLSLSNGTVWMGGNTIHGDLLCSNVVVHLVGAPNSVTGNNTCF